MRLVQKKAVSLWGSAGPAESRASHSAATTVRISAVSKISFRFANVFRRPFRTGVLLFFGSLSGLHLDFSVEAL
jgi:hypothetical protein